MSDRIEFLIDVLRQPGATSELADETRSVQTIASAITTSRGATPMNVRSLRGRKLRVASFVAAGVIGFGAVAAAGPGSFNESALDSIVAEADGSDAGEATDTSTTTTTTTTEPPVETAPPTSAAPETDAPTSTEVDPAGGEDELVDDPDTAFDERECAEGNHGQTVSSVARTPGRSSDDVRDAAHSSWVGGPGRQLAAR